MVLGGTHICENWRKKHVKAEVGLCPYTYFERRIHFSTVGSSECSSPKQSRLSVHPPPPHAHNSATSSSLSPLSTVTNTLSWWCTIKKPAVPFHSAQRCNSPLNHCNIINATQGNSHTLLNNKCEMTECTQFPKRPSGYILISWYYDINIYDWWKLF